MGKLALAAIVLLFVCHFDLSFTDSSAEVLVARNNIDLDDYEYGLDNVGRQRTRKLTLKRGSSGIRSGRSGDSVQCYTCTGCNSVDTSTPKSSCPKVDKSCVVYAENTGTGLVTTRGCTSVLGACAALKQAVACAQCESDNCNDVSDLKPITKGVGQVAASIGLTVITLISVV